MSIFSDLRSIVFLRRISRELHRMNELAELRISCEFPSQYKSYKSTGRPNFSPPTSRVVGISSPSYADWNDNYKREHGLDNPAGQVDDDDVFNHP